MAFLFTCNSLGVFCAHEICPLYQQSLSMIIIKNNKNKNNNEVLV